MNPFDIWDECSVSCGGGVRYRERHCHKDCVNNRIYHREPGRCNWEPCFEANVSGEWGEWSECSATCELGRKFRSRICESGPCMTREDQTAPKVGSRFPEIAPDSRAGLGAVFRTVRQSVRQDQG